MLLAGGRGERLGADKASLELGGVALAQRAVSRLAQVSDDVIVVRRPGQELDAQGARITQDLAPHSGVLAGMAAGLQAARHDWAIVAACDMPFLNADLLAYMATLTEGYDIVVPDRPVGLEPLHALYHRRCLPAILRTLDEGRGRVIRFYRELCVRHVPPADLDRYDPLGRSFFNINTPEDLAQAEAWVGAYELDTDPKGPA